MSLLTHGLGAAASSCPSMALVGWTRAPQAQMGHPRPALLLAFGLAAVPGPRRGERAHHFDHLLGPRLRRARGGHLELIPQVFPKARAYALNGGLRRLGRPTPWPYFTGPLLRRHPMASRLSPKKTWEGFVGGFIGSVLMVGLIGLYYHRSVELHSLLIGVTIGCWPRSATCSSRCSSATSRSKDAGPSFPGTAACSTRFERPAVSGGGRCAAHSPVAVP